MSFFEIKQHAPKAQKHIVQGNAEVKSNQKAIRTAKGKSVNYQCFCP